MSARRLQSSQLRSISLASAAPRARMPICPASCEIRTRPSRVDVLKRQRSCDAGERARPARQRGGMENTVAADLRRRVPDLRAVGRPGEPVRRRVAGRDRRLLPGAVDHGDGSAVVVDGAVVQERDPGAVGREPGVADPSAGLVQDLARREFEPALAALGPHDREVLAVGRPVGVLDVLEELAGRAPGRAHARERAGARERRVEVGLEDDGHLSRRGDGGDVGARNSERPRLRAFGPADVDLGRLSVPGGGRQDRLPVGAEARAPDGALAEGELSERRGLRSRPSPRPRK